ncbi:general secretion pathway protein D [Yersinia enterocolitica]|uniref:type II secretion system secretin GspD n=1 Tax=Yersinia enterocolitica TaxID=630 RepID=UPI00028197FA|nr:type II secretion system secretin GspD [Yersinia enterocolitica]AJI81531.1 type II secretion system protein D [Yersinia enterocolitica]EKA26510.1 general secretion pathway protein D [Yersinia enterocolitica subsp. enterocolitica WA-314]ELI8285017.1 type II secretion system secretin GspD [Yersinia enterocolitica]KGA69099.1 type II secretion system protein D [Yersinia enterocolitica]KGA78596.1 type II secretion system protein D [Yersinia enterocolitica]
MIFNRDITFNYYQYPRILSQRVLSFAVIILLLVTALHLPRANAETFSVNFKNTDINEFINTVSKNLNKTAIIDPAVKGNISVRSYQELEPDRYYPFFLSVLEVYGFTVVNMPGDVIKIIPAKNTKGSAIPLIEGENPAEGDEVVMRVVSLHNVAAKELAPLLRQLNDAAFGTVVHYDPSNVLLLTGRAAVVNQLVAIIKNVDKAGDQTVETIKLQFASASEVARIAESLHKSSGKNANGRMSATIVADERTNSVLIGGEEQVRQRMIDTVQELDKQGDIHGNTKVIYLKFAKAESLLDVLNGVSTNQQGGKGQATPAVAMMKNVVIKADAQTNSLIINAAPDLLRDLEQVINQLDIRRAQVLVEAIIVEVQDSDALNLGVQWFNRNGGGSNFPENGASASSITSNDMGSSLKGITGLATGFYRGNWSGLFTALRTNSQNDILATPSIVTLDNMEAEFSVGQEVPVLSGSQTTTGDNIFRTVDRKSVGIKLKVKPQINKGDSVLLEIEQEVSSVAEKAPGGTGDLGATFNTRMVKNAVMVGSNNIVVVGGLLDSTSHDVTSKVPLLGDIPGIGFLFRSTSQKMVKRNLMLFIRPTIIREQGDYVDASKKKLDKFQQEQDIDRTTNGQRINENLNKTLSNGYSLSTLQNDISAFYTQEAR